MGEHERCREQELRETQEKVTTFLKANGLKSVNDKRKKMCSSCYPVHVAIAQNNAEVVQCLVRSGADLKQKNSSGQTAQQLAQKCNKKGSHDLVLQALNNSS